MIKTLAARIKQYKLVSIITPILMAGEVFFEVLIPYLTADLVDNGITAGNLNHVIYVGMWLLLCAFASMGCGAGAGYTSSVASCGFAANLRHDMFHNVQLFSFSNIDKFSTSSIITRLTTDVSNIQNAYAMILRMAFRAPLSIIFAMIMSFRISVTLTLVFVYCIPFLAVGLAFIMMKTHPIFEKVFRRYDDLNRVVEEDLRGIRVVKSYVREDYEIDEFHKISKVIYDLFSRAEKNLAFNMPIMQTAIYASMIAISWIGANLIVASGNSEARGMTTGQLMSVMSYVMQILMSFMMLSMIFVMITMSRASGERISEILNEKSDITDPESPLTEVKNGDIEFKNVSFSYSGNEERLCLKNINLKINTGETVGILGGTGSSKSSFVQLIPRLYDVTDGEVLVGDENVKKYDIKKLRDAVAMVLQKNELFAGTIKENLRWGNPDATDEQIVEVCKMAQADSFIEDFPQKYDTYIEQGGTNVSGGQKQRLCIARALLKNPRILILDDSTSAVDTKTDADIRKAFKNYIPSVTKLIIAQRVASVMEADKIIIMNNGMIDGFGTHEELMKNNEIYREVYTSQMKGSEPDAE